MNQDSLVLVLTIFVGLVALSHVIQALALLRLQRTAKVLQDQITTFLPRAQSVLENAQQTLDDSRKQIIEVTSKANQVLDSTKAQLARVEELIADISTRTRSQLDRAEMVLDDTLGRVHETVATVHNGVMKPLKEISGISAGIRAAIAQMLKGARPSVAQVTQDEEMFI